MSPADTLQVLDRYSLVILPALAVAEQLGIPLPAVPALLGFGALVAHGRGSIPLMLGTLAMADLAVDFAWYEFGRRRGARVLTGLCRLSLEPDFCVRRAQNLFARFGVSAMLVAKFVPGLTTIVPPLAGVVAVGRIRFALYDLVGVLLWAGLWIGVGYVFSDAVAGWLPWASTSASSWELCSAATSSSSTCVAGSTSGACERRASHRKRSSCASTRERI